MYKSFCQLPSSSRAESLKNKEFVKKYILEKIAYLYENGYYLLANPLCLGYQPVDGWLIYKSIYKKKNVFVVELPSRFPHILNRNKSNNYHCKLIFTKER